MLGREIWWKYEDGQCQETTMSKLPTSHGGAKATDEERRIETASGERLNAVQKQRHWYIMMSLGDHVRRCPGTRK